MQNSRSHRGLCCTDLPIQHPYVPEDSFRESREMQECVTPSKHDGGAGILTCCPSTTPFGLALGPTNPGTIRVALETLGLRWMGFSPIFLLLMPTFSLRITPRLLPLPLQCDTNAPLPRRVLHEIFHSWSTNVRMTRIGEWTNIRILYIKIFVIR